MFLYCVENWHPSNRGLEYVLVVASTPEEAKEVALPSFKGEHPLRLVIEESPIALDAPKVVHVQTFEPT